jgi:tetratricopeptide (TPR) repeat protein
MGLIATEARDALAYHDRALALDPGFAEAHNGRGLALSRIGDLAAALASFTRALALWPGYIDALINAGNTLRKMGRFDEALSTIEQALRIDPNSIDALYSQAGILGAMTRMDEAIELCDRVLALDPAFSPAHLRRATLLGLLKRHEDAVAAFDRLLALPSEDESFYAKAHVLRGNSLRHLERLPEAIAAYDKALMLRPKFVEAWVNRGLALRQAREFLDAIDDFDQALALNPKHLDARNYRSVALANLGRNEEAEAENRRVLSIDPDNGSAYNSLGNALQRQGRLREALAAYETAIRLVPDPTAARFNYGMCLLLMGDYANGLREYEVRWQTEDWNIGWDITLRPLWDGSADIAGQTIMLYSEQGLGDTIQFCRYVPMVVARGARVVVGVPSSLRRLLESLHPEAEVIDHTQPPPAFDAHCSLMSLPLAFRTDLSCIPGRVPYLAPPEEYRALWRQRLGPRRGPRIGLAWSGGEKPYGRSIPLDAVAPLLAMLPEVFSLQRDLRPEDVPALAMHPGIRFFGQDLRDFCDTAALIEEMDLVISIDTSVLHLAGALGRPSWVMLAYAADWRWHTGRDDSPWYPTMRLFRQPSSGDWGGVIDRVCAALATCLGSLRAA